MRKYYDLELENLNNSLIEMGAFVEKSIGDSLIALRTRDHEMARNVIKRDNYVDQMEKNIEDRCLKLLLRQQPVAKDLRTISSTLKIITDLERIGDHAEDISEISIVMGDEKLNSELDIITKMYDEISFMIKTAIDAFITKDLELAQKVIDTDDKVDELFNQMKELTINHIQKEADKAEESIDLMQISKYLERVGDHAQNIAEWVIFSITGDHKNFTEE